MTKNFSARIAALAISALMVGSASASLTFAPFVSSTDLNTALSNTSAISFAYAGNKFVGSVYFGPNNNQLYQTNLSGGGVSLFGAPIAGASGEIYVSSSLGLGGFGSRDIFAGPGNLGSVYGFNNDGSGQVAFATGLSGSVRSIAFDPYGLYGFNMIVATTDGFIYKIDHLGAKTLLASTGEDTEGISFMPQAFGGFPAGTLVVASEGSGKIRAIDSLGNISTMLTLPSAEMVSFVPLNLGISGNPLEGFYAANYSYDVVKAAAIEFIPYIGDMIVTGETTHDVSDIKWDGTNFSVSSIGQFPNQPEDGIFVTAEVLNPGCGVTNSCGGNVPEPGSLALISLGLVGLAAVGRRKSA
jgi:hypothetical protein